MTTISFRCESCKVALKVSADKAGRKVRCSRCGTVVIIPVPETTKPPSEDPPAEVQAPAKPKRPRRRGPKNMAFLRTVPGWKKVRFGLILIACALCASLVLRLPTAFVGFANWVFVFSYFLQAISLTGYVFCAFVPGKGIARNLAFANLVLIVLGMGISIITTQRAESQSREVNKELESLKSEAGRTNQLLEEEMELSRKKRELNEQLDNLKNKTGADDKEASKQIAELSKRIDEVSQKQLENIEALQRDRAVQRERIEKMRKETEELVKDLEKPSIWWRFKSWFLFLVRNPFNQQLTQLFILAMFVMAISRDLNEEHLIVRCQRVILFAAVTLLFGLLGGGVVACLPNRVIAVITFVIGLAGFVIQMHMLIGACSAISDHLNSRPSEKSAIEENEG